MIVNNVRKSSTVAACYRTGDLNTARYDHAVAALQDGRGFVSGGYKNIPAAYIYSTELYDPALGTWSYGADVSGAWMGGTVTVLSDGRVLLCGGVVTPGSACYVYDPVANSWITTGAMGTFRQMHSSVLLPNGKVLVAGGSSVPGGVYLSSCELYDPVANTWAPAAAMADIRADLSLTLLPGSHVLANMVMAAGGQNGAASLRTYQIYNYLTNTWGGALNMGDMVFRSGHFSTIMQNGDILIGGGYDQGAFTPLLSSILFRANGTWFTTFNLPAYYVSSTAITLPTGNALICCGTDGMWDRTACRLFSPSTYRYTSTASLGQAHGGVMGKFVPVMLTNNRVLFPGGWNFAPTSYCELYY